MTATAAHLRHRRTRVRSGSLRRASAGLAGQPLRTLGLVLLGLALLAVMAVWPSEVSWAFYGPLIVVAGVALTPRWFLLTCLVYAACLAYAGWGVRGWSAIQVGTCVALVATMALMSQRSRSRERLGVQGSAGEDMLVDLRDRLLALARFPTDLPAGWHGESAIRSAFGDKFSGDFAVTSVSADRTRLEIVLVDLSGKGQQAGTRSLLFSGAFGGLLGSVEPERLLPAANGYLMRQSWTEHFASAVHVALDLRSGTYTIGNAGHPAPFQFIAGSGQWSVRESDGGPVLGIVADAEFPLTRGVLRRGDALVLYTDGMVERSGHDVATGLDRLIGSAERLVSHGFAGGARTLVSGARAGETDDRAVVVIWRD